MAKKKQTDGIAWTPPTPEERKKLVARDAARIAMETSPKYKKQEDAICSAIMKAMNKKLK